MYSIGNIIKNTAVTCTVTYRYKLTMMITS